jgi:hypothetical protein
VIKSPPGRWAFSWISGYKIHILFTKKMRAEIKRDELLGETLTYKNHIVKNNGFDLKRIE